jgi:uncharacterized damage-inducible protein DinB
MSIADLLVQQLQMTQKYFKNTLSVFGPEDEMFAPTPEVLSVTGHVAHTAHTVDWFMEGAFGEGWDMEFGASIAKAKEVTTLQDATAWLDRAFANAIDILGSQSDDELMQPIADTRMMGGAPRRSIVSGIVDHTAHHRGALAVYARLVDKVPVMPYS